MSMITESDVKAQMARDGQARHCSTCRKETTGAPLCDPCARRMRRDCQLVHLAIAASACVGNGTIDNLRRDEKLLAEYDKELKPCPFCGGEAKYRRYDISGEHYIGCSGCAIVVMFDVDLDEKDAIAHWNTRRTHVMQPMEGGEQCST